MPAGLELLLSWNKAQGEKNLVQIIANRIHMWKEKMGRKRKEAT